MSETSSINQPLLDASLVRTQFPVLDQEVNGKTLVYFDNAATNHKPERVIQALSNYYAHDNSNIHRGDRKSVV